MRMPRYEDLSKEQDAIFMTAPMDGAVLVTGPPGTGKTVMAFYRARACKKNRQTPLIIMFNKVLRRFVEQVAVDWRFGGSVDTWHSWIRGWWLRVFGALLPRGRDYDLNWGVVLDRAVRMSAREMERARWGHLIVDEGQDFPRQFYDLANFVVYQASQGQPGGNGYCITVFADENQRITGNNSTIKDIADALNLGEDRQYRLSRNYRNTKQIAKVAAHFYVGLRTGIPDPPEDRSGPLPVLRDCRDLNSTVDYIRRFASNHDDMSIAVFVPTKKIQKTLFNKLAHRLRSARGIKVQRYTSSERGVHGDADRLSLDKPGTVTVLCLHSCKGLEFDTVFIPELQMYRYDPAAVTSLKMYLYVMSSRARSNLYYMYSDCDGVAPPVLAYFPSRDSGKMEYEHD